MGYSYTAPPTTVPAGANLWKYQSGSSGDIDLNTAASVTGINAPAPGGSTYNLWLRQLAGFFFSAFMYISGGVRGMVGFTSQGGSRAVVGYDNQGTGERNIIGITSAYAGYWEAIDNLVRATLTVDKTQFKSNVQSNSAQNYTQSTQLTQSYLFQLRTSNAIVYQYIVDTTNTILERITPNGNMVVGLKRDGAGAGLDLQTMALYQGTPQNEVSVNNFKDYAYLQFATDKNGANNRMQVKARATLATIEYNDVQLFAVLNDGKLQTNQVETSTGGDATITDRIPIYNTAGVLQGYIPVMVNP